MLTSKATPEMLRQWKRLFERYHNSLKPNRKTGIELDKYFRENYPFHPCKDSKFREAVEHNITENEFYRSKLPNQMKPQINTYFAGNAFVGIDIVSGYFQVECGILKKLCRSMMICLYIAGWMKTICKIIFLLHNM